MPDVQVQVSAHAKRKYWVMWYIDPVTEQRKRQSTKVEIGETSTEQRKSKEQAQRKAWEWEQELRRDNVLPDPNITWETFCERYHRQKLAALSQRTQDAADTAFNHVDRLINPARLRSLTAEVLSGFQEKLRDEGLAEQSIATHLRQLRAALSWAKKVRLLDKVPTIDMPRTPKGMKLMRGRPITTEEFERMLEKLPAVRKLQPDLWKRYLRGLWLSGLRLEESLIVSWDADAPFSVDLSGKHPRFRIYAEAHKGRRDELLPMTPDFAEFLLQTPEGERHGPVFDLGAKSRNRVGTVISKIGRKAKVVIDKSKDQFASAHDLRRAFGTRWSSKVKPATLQRLMRHRSIETTLRYYVAQEADDIAAELWAGHTSVAVAAKTPSRAGEQAESADKSDVS